MQEKYRNPQSYFELNDVIDDAFKNAIARRNQDVKSEDDLLKLSNEEMMSVFGGGGRWHWDDYWEQWTDSFPHYAHW